ncbi:DUF2851 family protein [Porphyromonas loveana]|uniref:DUF2851 family protein n=1 Tax=Porphyromonas loveana TaxID=1884669 RepID=UPI00359F8030
MERFLQYVWLHRLYSSLSYGAGSSFIEPEVIDPGMLNRDSGPDFFNAKVRVGNLLWAGNVEIHRRSSDWLRHGHHLDPAYDNVVLHVVETDDCPIPHRLSGEHIPVCTMQVDSRVWESAHFMLQAPTLPGCSERLHELSPLEAHAWMDALVVERLERKAAEVDRLYTSTAMDWNATAYILLARHFGFGLNNDALERLARSLPYAFIAKHRSQLLQVEALLFGQAGLLAAPEDEYAQRLAAEYAFLRHKFDLQPLDAFLFRLHRTRPAAFIHRRLGQLAAILHRCEFLFSSLVETSTAAELAEKLRADVSPYWAAHYRFGKSAANLSAAALAASSLDALLINVAAPLRYAYLRQQETEDYRERTIDFLRGIKPENNRLVRAFGESLRPTDASESQALIQLYREYCERRKCFFCRWGYHFLSLSAR